MNCSDKVSKSGPSLLTIVSSEREGWIQKVQVRTDGGSCVRELRTALGIESYVNMPCRCAADTEECGRPFLLFLTLGNCFKEASCGSYGKV